MTHPTAVSESTRAKDLMAREVHSVDKDVHLEDVLNVMRRSKVSKVPVTEKGRLVGIVTDGSIAEKLGALHNKNVSTNTLHASSVMVRNVRCATPEDPWRHVLHLLDGDQVGLVPTSSRTSTTTSPWRASRRRSCTRSVPTTASCTRAG